MALKNFLISITQIENERPMKLKIEFNDIAFTETKIDNN